MCHQFQKRHQEMSLEIDLNHALHFKVIINQREEYQRGQSKMYIAFNTFGGTFYQNTEI